MRGGAVGDGRLEAHLEDHRADERCRREAPQALGDDKGAVACHGIEENRLPEPGAPRVPLAPET